ncbi:MAG: type II toxin-antitoxin system MqsA family antitoxin [Deltaproteobacteria bacterium]|nr:type II toxin-antitoxin system MqsA family antitoxin [Deltaproteobacteria bacterium]
MKACPICKHGERQPGTTSVTLSREGSTIVFENVPADVCDNCGESYLTEETTTRLFEEAKAATSAGFRVAVRAYAAA